MMPIVQTVNLKKYYQQGGNVVQGARRREP